MPLSVSILTESERLYLASRFFGFVDSASGPEACWPWRGRRNKDGYGIFDFKTAPILSHRTSFLLCAGIDDPGPAVCVCHSCDNPPCCNPGHLWMGSPAQNTADMIAKGRHLHNRARSDIDTAQASLIRERAANGENQSAIAREFGVSRSLIYDIVRRRYRWADI